MIGESYPRAHAHLRSALDAKSQLSALWGDLLDDEFLDQGVVVEPDGTGYLTVYASWPYGAKEELTRLFRTVIDELWACLDSLVVESTEIFAVRQRLQDSERPRFFPLADSHESLEELLSEACLNGVLRTQAQMIIDCQPFRDEPDDERVQIFRKGLKQLLDWTHSLDEGAEVGAWVTPVEPQVFVPAPAQLVDLRAAEPGELLDVREAAHFEVDDYAEHINVTGVTGTYVDLGFAAGYDPVSPDDTFSERVDAVLDVVVRFALSFEWLASQVPGSRTLTGSRQRPPVWRDARLSPRQWTEEELDQLAQSDFGVGVVRGTEERTLIVRTAQGVFERSIPSAAPLHRHATHGVAAELATQDAAATWGLPDFVMSPMVERKGRGVREISDGLIITGTHGLVIQVKARDTEPADTAKETNWLNKKIIAGHKQVEGTARNLSSKTTTMTNGRGRQVTVDGPTITWTGVVIIDHPSPPIGVPHPALPGRVPTVALLRQDWEFLFDQLRSSHAVIAYLTRVAGTSGTLGEEPERYYELAAADAATEPAPIDPRIRGIQVSVPLLPAAPAGTDDPEGHDMLRMMCEDIANSPTNEVDETRLLHVLAAIDALPILHRSDLGRLLLNGLEQFRSTEPNTTGWSFRTIHSPLLEAQLVFGTCSKLTDLTRTAFRSRLLLRHHDLRSELQTPDELTSIGVLLTRRTDGHREWDTTMMAITGDPELTELELTTFRDLWEPSTQNG
ncbi:hypothetical protein [Lentzea sp. NPDC003310]|uniref:hypothetical protein n=1 Tax=Lentzea sp. NPDC003310 TaxID=3154447 RepID=UPI0033BD8E02